MRQLFRYIEDSFWWQECKAFFRKGDMILLVLCLATSAFSLLVLSSITAYRGATHFLVIQGVATILGVGAYWIVSSIDLEFLAEHRLSLILMSLALLSLLIPFGVDHGSGNKSWIALPMVPFDIQPAEICKIFYIIVSAAVMASHQTRISKLGPMLHIAFILMLFIGPNMGLSRDLGVSLIFVFIFVVMAFSGGVKMFWFAGAAGILLSAWPFAWSFLSENQQNRILVIIDPTVDPSGLGPRWHFKEAMLSLSGGGLTGQGLYHGNRTQIGALQAQHTDFIFSAIGEELGFVGCLVVILLLLAIVARCLWVGAHSHDYMRKLVCYGSAGALIFQILVNVGMNIGMVPVIGLTLPLISYGGSSVLSIYAMLGLVSGVCARPAPRSHERYIQPPLYRQK